MSRATTRAHCHIRVASFPSRSINAFEAKLAGVAEDGLAVAFDMLVPSQAGSPRPHQHTHRGSGVPASFFGESSVMGGMGGEPIACLHRISSSSRWV
jgi:hypothetical protein